MDYEQVSNLSSIPQYEPIRPSYSKRNIGNEILFSIFSLIGIWADVLIVITIIKFQRLRKVSLIFIANWAFADMLSLILTPSSYRIISVLDHRSISRQSMCILIDLGATLHNTVQLFAIIVIINWTFEAFCQRGHNFIKRNYKYIIGIVWLSSVIHGISGTTLCATHKYITSGLSFFAIFCTYVLTVLIVIILKFMKCIQTCRKRPLETSTLMLTLVTLYVFSWFLGFLNTLFAYFIFYNKFMLVFSACLIFSSSLINFTLLYFCDEEFKACFKQLIKCRNNEYEESNLNYENSVIQTDANSSVVITFPKLDLKEATNKPEV